MDIYKRFYDEIAKAYIDHDADLSGVGNQAIVSLERVRLSLVAASADFAVRPAGCNCARFVLDGTHHSDCAISPQNRSRKPLGGRSARGEHGTKVFS